MVKLLHAFDDLLSGLAWSLWGELGVQSIENHHKNCLIHLEELVILTSILSEHDPRLREEAIDWLSRHHELISISRLRTYINELTEDSKRLFSRFAATLNFVSSAKWPYAENAIPFKVKITGKSILPSFENPSLLMLRLRALVGPGAKADILTHFMTRSELQLSAADLIEIGYSKRSLLTALDHLASSGIVAVKQIRNKKKYELKRPKELQVVIGKLPKTAPSWIRLIRAIETIRAILPNLQTSSDTTKTILLRNCLIEVNRLFPFYIEPLLQNTPSFENDWKALIAMFNSFRQGNFSMYYEVFDEFEKVVVNLLPRLYQLDDSVDGIEEINNKVISETNRHAKVYKECYQLFLGFIGDLETRLKQFLDFPFHKMMDEPLADIPYEFENDKLPALLDAIHKMKPVDQITDLQQALREYRHFSNELNSLRQFIYTFRKRLEDLYFVKTSVYLLSLPDVLYKRHQVYKLFRTED